MVFEVVGPLLRAELNLAHPFLKLNGGCPPSSVCFGGGMGTVPPMVRGGKNCSTLNNGPIDLGMVQTYR